MKTLVTGGAGFIGSTLVDRLLSEGHSVDVVDDLSSGRIDHLEVALSSGHCWLSVTDVRSDECAAVIRERRPEVIFHLAAQLDVRVSVARPSFDADVNVMGSLNVLQAAVEAGTRKLVFASSGGTIYGTPTYYPVREDHPSAPESPYGVAKRAVGDYLRCFRDVHGLDFTALALANVYGPRQDPHGEAGVVAIFGSRMLRGDRVTVFGGGSQTRDFVFVHDVVDAFVRSIDRAPGKLLNIGTGSETSVRDLFTIMAGLLGYDAEPVLALARAGEVERSSLDATAASIHLGWTPHSTLREGLAQTVAWFKGCDRAAAT